MTPLDDRAGERDLLLEEESAAEPGPELKQALTGVTPQGVRIRLVVVDGVHTIRYESRPGRWVEHRGWRQEHKAMAEWDHLIRVGFGWGGRPDA